eukprot:261310_1
MIIHCRPQLILFACTMSHLDNPQDGVFTVLCASLHQTFNENGLDMDDFYGGSGVHSDPDPDTDGAVAEENIEKEEKSKSNKEVINLVKDDNNNKENKNNKGSINLVDSIGKENKKKKKRKRDIMV